MMRSDRCREHGIENLRPQHCKAAGHDREYKNRLSRPEVRDFGHSRSCRGGSSFVNVSHFENFDKTTRLANPLRRAPRPAGTSRRGGGTAGRRWPPPSQRSVVCYFRHAAVSFPPRRTPRSFYLLVFPTNFENDIATSEADVKRR